MEKFCRKSQVHGLTEFHEYYWQKKNRTKSCFWIGVFMGAFTLMAYSIFMETCDFFEAPIVTSYHIHESPTGMDLPLIELCPSRYFQNRFFAEIRTNQTWRDKHINDLLKSHGIFTYTGYSPTSRQRVKTYLNSGVMTWGTPLDDDLFDEKCPQYNHSGQCACHWQERTNDTIQTFSDPMDGYIGCPVNELPINVTVDLCTDDVAPIGTAVYLKCPPYHQMFSRNFEMFFKNGMVTVCNERLNATGHRVSEWQFDKIVMPYLYCLPAHTPTSVSQYFFGVGYTEQQLIKSCSVPGQANPCHITGVYDSYRANNCFLVRVDNASVVNMELNTDPERIDLHHSIGDDAFFSTDYKKWHEKYEDAPFLGFARGSTDPKLLTAGIKVYLHSRNSFVPAPISQWYSQFETVKSEHFVVDPGNSCEVFLHREQQNLLPYDSPFNKWITPGAQKRCLTEKEAAKRRLSIFRTTTGHNDSIPLSYSQELCHIDCSLSRHTRFCGGGEMIDFQLVRADIHYKILALDEYVDCFLKNYNEMYLYYKQCMSECEETCVFETYKANTQCLRYPSRQNPDDKKIHVSQRHEMVDEKNVSFGYAYASPNIPPAFIHRGHGIRLSFGYSRFQYVEIKQEYVMTLTNFLANVGGLFGLWLGPSIITLIRVLWLSCSCCRTRKPEVRCDSLAARRTVTDDDFEDDDDDDDESVVFHYSPLHTPVDARSIRDDSNPPVGNAVAELRREFETIRVADRARISHRFDLLSTQINELRLVQMQILRMMQQKQNKL